VGPMVVMAMGDLLDASSQLPIFTPWNSS
jgi:hypothetical protein